MELLLPLILGWCFRYYGKPLPLESLSQSTDLSPSLPQIQDARNHVNQALQLLSSHDESYHFKTGAEVNKVCLSGSWAWMWSHSFTFLFTLFSMSPSLMQLMDAVMLQLTRARNRLTTPASMTLPELATSGLMVHDTRLWTLYTCWSDNLSTV